MKRLLILLFFAVACSRSQATADPSASTSASATGTCGTLGGSCSKEGETCSPAPIGSGWSHMLQCHSGKWTELEIAPLPTPVTATATVAASTSAQGRTQPAPRNLPKLDVSCNTDADCTVTSEEIQDDAPRTYACCSGCSSHAVNATWLQSFRAACAKDPAPMCPPIGCAMAIVKAVCRAHVCVTSK